MVLMVTVPVNTLPGSPFILPFGLLAKKLNTVEVSYPHGCYNLVGVQVWIEGRLITPSPGSNNLWLLGEGDSFLIPVNMNLSGNYQGFVYAYNLASDFQHTVTIKVEAE